MQRIRQALALTAVGLVFLAGCELGNQNPNKPVITASATTVAPGTVVNLTVTCTDPDGDPLTFTWCASGGTFNATTGTAVNWTAPGVTGTTTFTIRVIADDGKGGSSHASIEIVVTPGGSGGNDLIIGQQEITMWDPFPSNRDGRRNQFLYLGSEVNRTGRIVKLSLMSANMTRGTYSSFEIRICPTSRDTFETNFNNNYDGATPTRVYQRATQSYGSQDSINYWTDFEFDTGYDYTGGNFILEFVFTSGEGIPVSSHGYRTGEARRKLSASPWNQETGLPFMEVLYLKLAFAE